MTEQRRLDGIAQRLRDIRDMEVGLREERERLLAEASKLHGAQISEREIYFLTSFFSNM